MSRAKLTNFILYINFNVLIIKLISLKEKVLKRVFNMFFEHKIKLIFHTGQLVAYIKLL